MLDASHACGPASLPPRLDLVLPAHNEEHRLDRTLRAYRDACVGRTRLLVALDGCTDGTATIVRRHMAEDDRVVLLEFPKLGKGGVIAEAFRHCDADLIGFVDADCATAPGELLRLTDLADGDDGAIACRRHPASVLPGRRPAGRRVASTGFAAANHVLFRLPYADTQCGAKVVRREVIEHVLPYVSSRDFLFDVDFLLIARRLGFRIVEVPTVWTDRAGSRVRPVADAKKMFASALRLWIHHHVLPVEGERRTGPADADVIDLRTNADDGRYVHTDDDDAVRAHA